MRLNAVVVQWTGPDPLQLRMMVEPAVRAFWVWSGWRWELNRMDGGAGASGTNRKSEHLNSEWKFTTPIKRVVHHSGNNVAPRRRCPLKDNYLILSLLSSLSHDGGNCNVPQILCTQYWGALISKRIKKHGSPTLQWGAVKILSQFLKGSPTRDALAQENIIKQHINET